MKSSRAVCRGRRRPSRTVSNRAALLGFAVPEPRLASGQAFGKLHKALQERKTTLSDDDKKTAPDLEDNRALKRRLVADVGEVPVPVKPTAIADAGMLARLTAAIRAAPDPDAARQDPEVRCGVWCLDESDGDTATRLLDARRAKAHCL